MPGSGRRGRTTVDGAGQDFDAYAAAALAGTTLDAAATLLDALCHDHLLQQAAPGRYTMHDLIRAYATDRSADDDAPAARRAALTRLFDYCLAAAARAMDVRHPAEAHRRPPVTAPATPLPDLAGPDAALAWLDTERAGLVAVAAHTNAHGWPAHTTRLAAVLYRYLTGGHLGAALSVHAHAADAALAGAAPPQPAPTPVATTSATRARNFPAVIVMSVLLSAKRVLPAPSTIRRPPPRPPGSRPNPNGAVLGVVSRKGRAGGRKGG
ncbi:hypothetical protein AB0H83_15815 [Dactylosporangium sp. NPDC050688]|uniref:hypothetical protein n=1 Tax=Dactylosporangium sp. NPDC050688 TaxID=3157217 RepID=UPI0033F2CF58